MRAALSRVAPADVGRVLVAYEPIWAIGEHGRPATQDQIAPVMALIADVVAEPPTAAERWPCSTAAA